MICGVTGTRHGMTIFQQNNWIYHIEEHKPDKLIHGDCVGVDVEAATILENTFDSIIEVYAPDNSKHRAFHVPNNGVSTVIPGGYLVRNRLIVDNSDYIVVFPYQTVEQQYGGTWYTYRYAVKQKKPTTIFWPNGEVELSYNR